jgi:hypothetical protein
VTGLELAAQRSRLGISIEALAADLNEHVDEVRRWETVTGDLPRDLSRRLDWILASHERAEAFARSGLPDCDWAEAKALEIHTSKPADSERLIAELDAHIKTCEICQRRTAFAETLPPLPSMPTPPTLGAIVAIGNAIRRLPQWLRPAATGAVLVGAWTILRAFFILLGTRGAHAGHTLLMVLEAVGLGAYGGAVGGFAYTLAKKPAARLGVFGPYALGLACGYAYLLAFGIPLRFLTSEETFRTTSGWVLLVIIGTVFGLLLGHFLFRKTKENVLQG